MILEVVSLLLALAAPAPPTPAVTLPAVVLLPLLPQGSVSNKQATGLSAALRSSVESGDYAKVLSQHASEDAKGADLCRLDIKCLAALADERGADLIVAGTVSAAPDGLRVNVVVVRPHDTASLRNVELTVHGKESDDMRMDMLATAALRATPNPPKRESIDGPVHVVTAEPEVWPPPVPMDSIVLGSIGAGLIVLGGISGSLALKDSLDVEERAKSQQLTFPKDSGLLLRGQIFAYTADGLAVAGGLAIGGATALWLLSDGAP